MVLHLLIHIPEGLESRECPNDGSKLISKQFYCSRSVLELPKRIACCDNRTESNVCCANCSRGDPKFRWGGIEEKHAKSAGQSSLIRSFSTNKCHKSTAPAAAVPRGCPVMSFCNTGRGVRNAGILATSNPEPLQALLSAATQRWLAAGRNAPASPPSSCNAQPRAPCASLTSQFFAET